MNEIIETIKNFLRDPLWQDVGSVATAIVVIFTYLSLKQYRETEIDRLVYKLYGLTKDEIKIVEENK